MANTFPSYSNARWIRQNNRVYYERRWNEDEAREERKRTETITAYRECTTASTKTAEFNAFFNQRKLPPFKVYYSGEAVNSYSDTYEDFSCDDVDVYDYGTAVSRVTITASISDDNWYYQDGNGDWVEVEE